MRAGKYQRVDIRLKRFVILAQACSYGRQELENVVPDKVPFRRGERMPAGEDFGLKSNGSTLSHGRKAFGANIVLRAV